MIGEEDDTTIIVTYGNEKQRKAKIEDNTLISEESEEIVPVSKLHQSKYGKKASHKAEKDVVPTR